MASPTRYDLSYSFADFQTANPSIPLPADKLEIEFNNLTLTTDEIITNLDLIQRSDGALKNQIVSFDSLSNDVKVLLGSAITPKGAWLTATAYVQLDLVTESGSTYLATSDHTSGTFATDLAAGKWILWAASNSVTINNSNWSGTDLAVTNGGTGVSTLTGLVKGNGTSPFTAATQGVDYYKPGGTDVALADGGTGSSTASGARTNLGLGGLAVLSTVNNDNWSGTDLSIDNGGTGASTPADARSALDVYSKGETDALLGSGGIPSGSIFDYAGTAAPSGYLFCYGQAVSRTTYATLFTAISTTYGTGDGSTTFNLPDLRGRVTAGQDDMGGTSANRLTGLSGGLDGDTLGAVGGAESHTLLTAEMPSHTHSVTIQAGGSGQNVASESKAAARGTQTSGSAGGGGAHNNVQPTIILNKIIKT